MTIRKGVIKNQNYRNIVYEIFVMEEVFKVLFGNTWFWFLVLTTYCLFLKYSEIQLPCPQRVG